MASRFDSGTRFQSEAVMLLKTDGKPARVWGVVVGRRHEVLPTYLCDNLHQAGQLAAEHARQRGESAWPVELMVTVARVDE